MWWVLTDTEKKIMIEFEQHKFNETQKVSFLDDTMTIDAKELASIMSQMGDWMFANAYYIGMPLDDCRAWCSYILNKEMQEQGVTVEELSEKSGFRTYTIEKILEGKFVLKVRDMVAILSALGKRFVIE